MRLRTLILLVSTLCVGGAIWIRYENRDSRPPLERFQTDPTDFASADEWLQGLGEELLLAEQEGRSEALYKEGKVAAQLLQQSPKLATRPSFLWTQAIFLMANEPLVPASPKLVLRAIEANPRAKKDPRFVKLLKDTLEQSAADPVAHEQYAKALTLLGLR